MRVTVNEVPEQLSLLRSLLFIVAIGVFLGTSNLAFGATCPNPLPDNPSGDQLRDCLNDIAMQRADLEDLKIQVLTLKSQLIQIDSVPAGAVLSFDRNDLDDHRCPIGWVPYLSARARVIVGAGNPRDAPDGLSVDQKGAALTGYALHQSGGEQKHQLQVDEMPSHSHKLNTLESFTPTTETTSMNSLSGWTGHEQQQPWQAVTAPEGGNKPHNIMPPFVALYYCKKE